MTSYLQGRVITRAQIFVYKCKRFINLAHFLSIIVSCIETPKWDVCFLANDSRAMEAIREGMDEWTTKTCIRFKKRTNEADYVYFKLGDG